MWISENIVIKWIVKILCIKKRKRCALTHSSAYTGWNSAFSLTRGSESDSVSMVMGWMDFQSFQWKFSLEGSLSFFKMSRLDGEIYRNIGQSTVITSAANVYCVCGVYVLGCEPIRIQACAHLVNFNQWINDGLRTKWRDGFTNVLLKNCFNNCCCCHGIRTL